MDDIQQFERARLAQRVVRLEAELREAMAAAREAGFYVPVEWANPEHPTEKAWLGTVMIHVSVFDEVKAQS